MLNVSMIRPTRFVIQRRDSGRPALAIARKAWSAIKHRTNAYPRQKPNARRTRLNVPMMPAITRVSMAAGAKRRLRAAMINTVTIRAINAKTAARPIPTNAQMICFRRSNAKIISGLREQSAKKNNCASKAAARTWNAPRA